MNKSILFILVLVLAAVGIYFFYFADRSMEEGSVARCSADSFGAVQLEGRDFMIMSEDHGAGRASVSGRVVVRERVLWDEPVQVVYIELEESDSPFQTYFREMFESNNTVNVVENGNLLFKLGAIVNGEFSSTADVSAAARGEIESALVDGRSIFLNVEVPVYAGGGAPEDFSFACAINRA